MLDVLAVEHRDSIVNEYRKRLAKKDKEQAKQALIRDETNKRREERTKRKEEKRLDELKNKIEDQIVAKSVQVEDPTMAKICDIITSDKEKHLFVIGGLLGEMLLTLIKVNEMMAMANQEFKMTPETIDVMLRSIADTFGKSEAFIDVPFIREIDFAALLAKEDLKELREALAAENFASPALRYILERLSKFGINSDLTGALLIGIMKLKHKKLEVPLNLVPELTEEKIKDLPEEEKVKEKENIAKQNEEIKQQNAEIKKKNDDIERENALLSQIQSKIRILNNPELPEKGRICAIARVGPMAGPPTPKGTIPSHNLDDLNSSKRNQKSQPVLALPKHLTLGNFVDDSRVIVVHRSMNR